MPAIPDQAVERGMNTLQKRDERNTVGHSGMTPTALAFLIPVFVVIMFCPVLCVYCLRWRHQVVPVVSVVLLKSNKQPSLRRAEARERLDVVTEASTVTSDRKRSCMDMVEERERAGDSASVSERECAICLSTLQAPSPPEPALLNSLPTIDEAATRPPSVKDAEGEAILKLNVCGHEFHAECLTSWVVLRKTTCPICRAVYISKEEMTHLDEEAALALPQEMVLEEPVRANANRVPISNWRYFWHGESAWNRQDVN